jgi:serine-type D-Ala-D-Ala carboxypeptidase (penicillin-binding protein 5/6)
MGIKVKKPFIIFAVICLLFGQTATSYAHTVSATAKVNETVNTNKDTNNNDTKDSKTKGPESLTTKNKPSVNSKAAIVMEASTGTILYEKNIHKTFYPASITKILTALLAIENSNLGETVTFSKDAIYDVDLDSSRIGIDVGEQLTMEQCLYGIMLESANEVSYAIAEHVAGSVDAFADLMNEKAKELGCTDSHFVNPHGLPDENHYTTAYDMALISRAAINNETFQKITSTKSYTIPPTNIQEKSRPLANHHKFVKGTLSFDGCIGGKTGYTTQAHYTLVTFAERNGMKLISVIMNCDSITNEYGDTAALLNYGFDNYSLYNVSEMEDPNTVNSSDLFTKYSPLFSPATSQLQISSEGNIVLPNNIDYKKAEKQVILTPIDKVKNGENIIGKINYTYKGTYVGSANIIYNNTTASSTLKNSFIPTPTPDADKQSDAKSDASQNSSSLKIIIIGIIVFVVMIALTLYIVFVELPYRRRRNNYREKKDRKKRSSKKDYFDF